MASAIDSYYCKRCSQQFWDEKHCEHPDECPLCRRELERRSQPVPAGQT